jgi:hypothetical protein
MSKVIGSRAQVWHGTATHTSGGLTKNDLMMNKYNRIVSKRRHAAGQNAIKHLEKSGHKGKLPSKRNKNKKGGRAYLDEYEDAWNAIKNYRMSGKFGDDPYLKKEWKDLDWEDRERAYAETTMSSVFRANQKKDPYINN